MTTMHYKGYEATIEFDEHANVFNGEVVNLRDVITFQGSSAAQLKQAFAESVKDYLAFCAERGEEPEKPFSGQFVVQAEPDLHKAISSAAQRAGVSLNKWVVTTLERSVR
ncbi:type II toxin-antitoxin system HicB family antitoxin [Phyllobacterium brassicacearum]|nr:type II toxin-antitoxin system HicB family antitoxin [Phyllobacterium brassicacearum]TDQ35763.1 putative HicB family RNase H-like nuclease [Phyllobacterium brassicacearum]